MYRNVFAIIVVYNPNIEDLNSLIGNLLNQTNKVIVCNNSSFDLNLQQNIKLFNFQENLGIAKAQSIGMKWAFNNDADFILQMDQDSFPDDDMITSLLNKYNDLLEHGYPVGIVAPQDYDEKTLLPSKSILLDENKTTIENVYEVDFVISSGCIISKECYLVVGGMYDDLFIDSVDIEYCWRAINSGFLVYKDLNSKLFHRLGNGVKVLTPYFTVCICAPFRHYYVYRNCIFLTRKGYAPLKWKVKIFIKLILTFIATPFIFENSHVRMKFMLKGIKDGVLGRLGKL